MTRPIAYFNISDDAMDATVLDADHVRFVPTGEPHPIASGMDVLEPKLIGYLAPGERTNKYTALYSGKPRKPYTRRKKPDDV